VFVSISEQCEDIVVSEAEAGVVEGALRKKKAEKISGQRSSHIS